MYKVIAGEIKEKSNAAIFIGMVFYLNITQYKKRGDISSRQVSPNKSEIWKIIDINITKLILLQLFVCNPMLFIIIRIIVQQPLPKQLTVFFTQIVLDYK